MKFSPLSPTLWWKAIHMHAPRWRMQEAVVEQLVLINEGFLKQAILSSNKPAGKLVDKLARFMSYNDIHKRNIMIYNR